MKGKAPRRPDLHATMNEIRDALGKALISSMNSLLSRDGLHAGAKVQRPSGRVGVTFNTTRKGKLESMQSRSLNRLVLTVVVQQSEASSVLFQPFSASCAVNAGTKSLVKMPPIVMTSEPSSSVRSRMASWVWWYLPFVFFSRGIGVPDVPGRRNM